VLALYGGEAEQREALSIFEGLGAAPAAQALRKQMRAQGIRRVPRGARATTQSHLHGLTAREAEILALMSDGLRNAAIAKRLFVSTRTVDHHVSAILTKLGVQSRAKAIAIAHPKVVKDLEVRIKNANLRDPRHGGSCNTADPFESAKLPNLDRMPA
jgi:DNA-binding CsgD family transcriptional regulator